MTWRTSDEVLERVRQQAQRQGRSLNDWVTAVLAAASDPSLAGSEAEQIRERLAHAGLLARTGPARKRPSPQRLAAARAAAGQGKHLSELVAEGR